MDSAPPGIDGSSLSGLGVDLFLTDQGRYKLKVVPIPTWLVTSIQPRCCSTISRTVDNPRPVPLPNSLVVKNGSKIRDKCSAGIPAPVSVTLRCAYWPGRLRESEDPDLPTRTLEVSRVSRPPSL